MYIDSHSHFDICLEDKTCTEEIMLSNLKDNNIKYAVQISVDIDGLEWAYNFAKNNKNILFTAGIHPSSRASQNDLQILSEFVVKVIESDDKKKLFGIGETGLDFYRMRQPKNIQIQSFEYQISIANKYELPVIVHSRDAMEETLEILKKNQPKQGIMHCFSGDSEAAKKFIDLGFYISFAGNLTYKKAINLHDAASYVPIDRLLVETDAPYLTPAPLRGKKNRSEYVIHTYNFLAELRNEKLTKLEDNIYGNFISIK